MEIKERIIANEAEAKEFIREQVELIKKEAKNSKTICFVSGGVDSSVVAILAHHALGGNLKNIFVDNGLMREGEIEWIQSMFHNLKLPISVIDKAGMFFSSLFGKVTPYEKRTAIREEFYYDVLPAVANEFGATCLLQGTNLTDVEATALNSEAPQHNVLNQIGIGVGMKVIEPLDKVRKPSVRVVARALGLPESIWKRMPFPGPALAARIVGEVTREKVEIIRKVTAIVEQELSWTSAFQYLAVLVSDMVPNHDRTKLGYGVVIECINSTNALTSNPVMLSVNEICFIRDKIYFQVPEVFRVAWDFSTKPPAAIEWV